RGPFSTLYGNASGGVISIFTEDGTDPPQAQAQIVGGSYGTYNAIAKVQGIAHGVGYVVAGNHFATDGYRDHSEASRDLVNAKLKFNVDPDTRVTLIANSLYQPEAQDPLGLTRAQWQADPRQSDPSSVLFNTRKTVNQQQGGATLERQLGSDTVARLTVYGGRRLVRQYLALAGTLPTSSGGVTDLDGDFEGVDGRVAYSHFSPVGGAVWHVAREVNVYVNWGEGFETPSFIELAYRTVGTGLNFDLRPAVSRSAEAGIKAYVLGGQKVNLAVFSTKTSDEIVIDTATGGRTTYKNASKTRRRGVE